MLVARCLWLMTVNMLPTSRRCININPSTITALSQSGSPLLPRRPLSFKATFCSHPTLLIHPRTLPSFIFLSTQHGVCTFFHPKTIFIKHLLIHVSSFEAFSVSARDLSLGATPQAQLDHNESATNKAEEDSYKPKMKPFSDIESFVSPELYLAITQKPFGYSHMSAVQDKLLSDLPNLIQTSKDTQLKTKDLVVKAKMGTNKTLAFLIPAIESRLRDLEAEKCWFKKQNPDASHQQFTLHMGSYEKDTTGIVVISPTPDLATQIAQEAVKLTSRIKQFGVRLFVGEASKSVQLQEWNSGRRDIVVATPDRLKVVLKTNPSVRKNLLTTQTLIMDEADTLLEMGFKEEINSIVQQLPPREDRLTYLFSATISPQIQQIVEQTMKQDRMIVDCLPAEETNVDVDAPQYYTVLPSAADQITHLFNLIAQDQLINPNGKTIVFLPTTKMTQLFSQLIHSFRRHLPWNSHVVTKVYEMHGGKSQHDRENIAKDFRTGAGGGYQILATSDVSAKGSEYPGVTRVIQMGIPIRRQIYVHRVGRTGRADKAGRGDLILLDWEQNYVENVLQDLPLKPMLVSDLKKELMDLASKIDKTGQAPTITQVIRQRTNNSQNEPGPQSSVSMSLPVLDRLKCFEGSVKESIISSLGEKEIQEAFGSLLGYYATKISEIQGTKENVLEGLTRWAIDGMKLDKEPHVSPDYLKKLGFYKESESGKSGGGGAGGVGSGRGRRKGGNGNSAGRRAKDWCLGNGEIEYTAEDMKNPIFSRAIREINDMFGNTGGYYGNASRAFKAGLDYIPKPCSRKR